MIFKSLINLFSKHALIDIFIVLYYFQIKENKNKTLHKINDKDEIKQF